MFPRQALCLSARASQLLPSPDRSGQRHTTLAPVGFRHIGRVPRSSLRSNSAGRLARLWLRRAVVILTMPMHDEAVSEPVTLLLGRFRNGARNPWEQAAPLPVRPEPEPVKVEIEHGRRVKGQELADDQPADDRDPKRAPDLTSIAEAERQRDGAENRSECCHHDRAKPQDAGAKNRVVR